MKTILRPLARLFANRTWACSRLAAVWMYGEKRVARGDITIIPNAIDLSLYAFDEKKRNRLRKDLGIEETLVIGHVGRFMYQKNHDFLIDTFAKALEKDPSLTLLLIGDGPLRPAMEEKVKHLHIEKKVRFLGLRKDVQDLYNAMDIFLLPSHYEGLPVVGVEAQANGLPCLAADTITQEMKLTTGVTYKNLADGPDAWADTLLTLPRQRNGDVKEEMKQAGFDIDTAAARLAEKYTAMSIGGGHLFNHSAWGGHKATDFTACPLARLEAAA